MPFGGLYDLFFRFSVSFVVNEEFIDMWGEEKKKHEMDF